MATRRKTITDKLDRERKATRASFGKLRQQPSGRWQASYVGPDGVRHFAPKTFELKTPAEDFLVDARARISKGLWRSPASAAAELAERSQTLGDYAETWLASRTNSKGDHLRPRTVDEYRRLLAGPLSDLTPLIVGNITAAKVRTWRSTQLATGRKTQTSRAYGLLNAIMNTAAGDRLIDANPCTIKGGQSTHTGRKVLPPTDTELETILDAITPRYRALVIIAAQAGLRYGEATALRAKDVSVERDEAGQVAVVRLNVERGVVRTSEGITPGATKSEAGVRRVSLFAADADDVAEHVRGLIGDALLFPARDGVSYLSQSAFWKHWNPARITAGRADMPFHALRHYAGTSYTQKGGGTTREVQDFLGHASARAAMRYQHSGNRDDELAERMARRRTTA